jgi:hypothetical protein
MGWRRHKCKLLTIHIFKTRQNPVKLTLEKYTGYTFPYILSKLNS